MKKNRHLYFIVFVVFIIYLAALCYMLFFAESFGRGHIPDGFDKINLVPFREMQRFISKWETVGAVSALLNTLGNVIGFIPLGIFVPILFKKTRRVWKQLLMGFMVSLAVETIQLVFDVGVFDVDDLILNTVGTIVGYALFRLIVYMIGKRER
ncbi:MAG: VanZ family protein [Candidatus Alectryocaccobium sp.]|nr:VanZ family protein [Candidatus Alectryocaccobium sp.]